VTITASIRQGTRIFYRAWSHNRPTGGQKQMYRHVDILNSSGSDAYIFHDRDGFRLSWFDNDTRVVGPTDFKSLYRRGRDILVLSEDIGLPLSRFPGPKVIFVQGIHEGFLALGDAPPERYPYQDAGVLGVITVSEHSRQILTYAFPDIRVLRVVNGIDLNRYQSVALANKSPIIATILKKVSYMEVKPLFHMLNARAQQSGNPLKDFEWTFIKDNTEVEVASLLQRAVLFIFLSGIEGFPLLPLEAMAAGAILAAPDVDPLREYVPEGCRFRPGDLVGLARWVEAIAASRVSSYAGFEELVLQGQTVAKQYDLERERESVLSVWRVLLS
jgi:glycosyltransferase involved in cell wall biosynthesis